MIDEKRFRRLTARGLAGESVCGRAVRGRDRDPNPTRSPPGCFSTPIGRTTLEARRLDDVIAGLDPERQGMLLKECVGPRGLLTQTTSVEGRSARAQMYAVKSVLRDALIRLLGPTGAKQVAILNAWRRVVGEPYALHTDPVGVRGRVLIVATRAQTVAYELRLRRRELVKALNASVGCNDLEDIVVVLRMDGTRGPVRG